MDRGSQGDIIFFDVTRCRWTIFALSCIVCLLVVYVCDSPTADWGSMVRENANLIQFAQYDLRAGLTPLLPAAAIALLTVAVNFVVDWMLFRSSGLKER